MHLSGPKPIVYIHGRPTMASLGTAGFFDVVAKPFVSAAKTITKPVSSAVKTATKIIEAPVKAVSKIPIVGDAAKLASNITTAPLHIASAIASGARLDHVALDALKNQIKVVKDAAPYAQTVVAFVPGVGTGVAAAIGAGAALAEGQSITEAAKAAIRGALPGGAIAAAAFDTAMRVAAGENVAQSALESTRALLPSGPAQSAFDIGVAVATGEKLQNALAKGILSIAPGQLQTVLETGQKALKNTPGLEDAFKKLAPGAATEGFQLAAGLLAQKGINEKALTAVREKLPLEVIGGFDAALKTQENHLAWLKNVTSAPLRKTPTIKSIVKPAAAAPTKTTAPDRQAAPATTAKPAPTKPLVKLISLKKPASAVAPATSVTPTAATAQPATTAYAPYPF